MDYVIYISIVLLFIFLLFLFFKNNKKGIKTKEQKQDEIKKQYKTQMNNLYKKYKQNPDKLRLHKIQLLKNISRELEFNIFFTKEETRKIVQDLAQEH